MPSINMNILIYVPRLVNNVLDPILHDIKPEGTLHYTETLSQEPILSGANFTLSHDPGKKRVPIRILSSLSINKLKEKSKNSCCSSSNRENHKFDKIIIHIHGGGYIGMSTFSYQAYTRSIANALNVPVFSIDYRLAPENKFPDGLDDV